MVSFIYLFAGFFPDLCIVGSLVVCTLLLLYFVVLEAAVVHARKSILSVSNNTQEIFLRDNVFVDENF